MNFALAIVALVGAGLTATLSPCVLPLVPGIVGVLVDGAGEQVDRRQRVLSMVLFATGATTVFIALGVGAGVIGAVAGGGGQRFAGTALIAMSVLWFAARRGRSVPSIQFVQRFPATPRWRALVLGVGCGAAWTPCAGPLLGAALSAAGARGASDGAVRSAVLLGAYAVGVLAPFVALAGLGIRRIPGALRTWGRLLSPISAVVMLVLGVALASGWYESLVARLVV